MLLLQELPEHMRSHVEDESDLDCRREAMHPISSYKTL